MSNLVGLIQCTQQGMCSIGQRIDCSEDFGLRTAERSVQEMGGSLTDGESC